MGERIPVEMYNLLVIISDVLINYWRILKIYFSNIGLSALETARRESRSWSSKWWLWRGRDSRFWFYRSWTSFIIVFFSVLTFPTYSSHYHDPAEDLNISQYFNLTEVNTTSSLEDQGDEDLPRMTNLGLAVALYMACLATVFGNSLVVIAVVKVGLKYLLSRKSDKTSGHAFYLFLKRWRFLQKNLSVISYSIKLHSKKCNVCLREMSGLRVTLSVFCYEIYFLK